MIMSPYKLDRNVPMVRLSGGGNDREITNGKQRVDAGQSYGNGEAKESYAYGSGKETENKLPAE